VNDTPENTDQPTAPSPPLHADDPEPLAPSSEQAVPPPPVTMLPAAEGPAPPRQSASCLLRSVVSLVLILAVASLVLNGFLLYSLNNVRQAAMHSLDAALAALEGLESKGLHYAYPFSDTLPIAVEIPVKQEMMIPIQEDFAINTEIKVPIDAGILGTFVLNVPINTSIPLDVEVPVQISQTVLISTSLPLSLTVPIDIRAEDPPVQRFIDTLRRWLQELRDSFEINVPLTVPGSM
jgi:type II secretory pathway pseudopilin PulG